MNGLLLGVCDEDLSYHDVLYKTIHIYQYWLPLNQAAAKNKNIAFYFVICFFIPENAIYSRI